MILNTKVGFNIFEYTNMTTLDIAALLGKDEIIVRLLPTIEILKGHKDQINVLYCSYIGGNLSTLEFLLNYNIDSLLCGS